MNDSPNNITHQLSLLKRSVAILLLAVIALTIYIFTSKNTNSKELTLERLNIIEKDGTIRMVISNRQRQHPGRMDNKDLLTRERPAGIIFFNDEGNEDGGLVYDGNEKEASMVYSFDQYKNDQIMQLRYLQEKVNNTITRSYGLNIWDRKDDFTLTKQLEYFDSLKALNDSTAFTQGVNAFRQAGYTHPRLFVGKNAKEQVGLFLNDANGKPRLNIYINTENQPVIEVLNDKGEVIDSKINTAQ